MCQLESSQKRGGGCGCLHTRAPRKDVKLTKAVGWLFRVMACVHTRMWHMHGARVIGGWLCLIGALCLVRYMLFICYRLSMVMVQPSRVD